MELLFSNYPPLRTAHSKFVDCFYEQLNICKGVDISVGYITADSLTELKSIAEQNDIHRLNLTIGMHYFNKFSALEYNAAIDLNQFLQSNGLGQVNLVTTFMYHGKLYSFVDDNGIPKSGIIGSNNLSSIIDSGIRSYESSVLITENPTVSEINNFISELVRTSCRVISEVEIDSFNNSNHLLDNHSHVRKLTEEDVLIYKEHISDISFEIPIKANDKAPKSNLNTFFGKGRRTPNGMVMPRHWYEVELIVPRNIATLPDYPVSGTDNATFDVVTDDGWKFTCKVSGGNNKNLRSENDLKILGKWIKGRLENAGCLRVGDPVTLETLARYGRDTVSLKKLDYDNIWYIDFGVE